jgi:hypothetical protein
MWDELKIAVAAGALGVLGVFTMLVAIGSAVVLCVWLSQQVLG